MPRNKKKPSETRKARTMLWLTDNEYKQWKKLQQESGIKQEGPFIRQQALNNNTRKIIEKTIPNDLRFELNKVGVNLNQVMRIINSKEKATQDLAIEKNIKELKTITLQLESVLKAILYDHQHGEN